MCKYIGLLDTSHNNALDLNYEGNVSQRKTINKGDLCGKYTHFRIEI